ncbi:uncharacterized protein LY89DRAFT_753679 [Mollisia scopiformis]|uniref:Uncharacterized protein n=1 Tax=Mollisia scopiformis TaxID=149040 RepID=A0A194WZM7_MOLSC|nr:uncharacterized protein LY89DRAFT_753679 [Mollisia scopiformis]KUJ13164.1 hypothetical protein LY89DRAFT_753679 [Mollisia scopiformis]
MPPKHDPRMSATPQNERPVPSLQPSFDGLPRGDGFTTPSRQYNGAPLIPTSYPTPVTYTFAPQSRRVPQSGHYWQPQHPYGAAAPLPNPIATGLPRYSSANSRAPEYGHLPSTNVRGNRSENRTALAGPEDAQREREAAKKKSDLRKMQQMKEESDQIRDNQAQVNAQISHEHRKRRKLDIAHRLEADKLRVQKEKNLGEENVGKDRSIWEKKNVGKEKNIGELVSPSPEPDVGEKKNIRELVSPSPEPGL